MALAFVLFLSLSPQHIRSQRCSVGRCELLPIAPPTLSPITQSTVLHARVLRVLRELRAFVSHHVLASMPESMVLFLFVILLVAEIRSGEWANERLSEEGEEAASDCGGGGGSLSLVVVGGGTVLFDHCLPSFLPSVLPPRQPRGSSLSSHSRKLLFPSLALCLSSLASQRTRQQ